jgi:cob(I)alamin adenosyltransferase
MKSYLGKIHVYTGNGSGKTKAALGLALRAVGQGLKVAMIQFMKGQETGEKLIQKKLEPNFKMYSFGQDTFIKKGEAEKTDKDLAKLALNFAQKVILSRDVDVLILDEINVACDFGLISEKDVLDFLDKKSKGMEIILTGRNASKKVIDKADLVTEMKKIKHYYDKGVKAREGIEY